MLTNNIPEALLISVVSFLAGFALGQFVRFRRTSVQGHEVLKPALNHSIGALTGFRVVVIGLFLVATAFLVNFTITQRGCNAEFQRTITERARAAQQESVAKQESDQALYDMVTGLLSTPPDDPQRAQTNRQLLEDYVDKRDAAKVRYDQSQRVRQDNPYPEC